MTAYSSRFQLDANHVFFDPSSGSPSIGQCVEMQHHDIAGEVKENQICRTAGSQSGRENHDDGDEGYGLHYHYGKLWDSRTSEPVKEIDLRAHAWKTTTASATEWLSDATHRVLPHNQTPLHRPPEIYESAIRQTSVLGVVGQSESHPGGPTDSFPSSSSPVEPVSSYPMSRLSRLSVASPILLPRIRRNNVNHLLPHPDSRQVFLYQPTQEELDACAHQPVPPEKLSSYSELSPHIEFMQRLKFEETLEKEKDSSNLAHNSDILISPLSPISNHTRLSVNDSAAAVDSNAIATANAMALTHPACPAQVPPQSVTLPTSSQVPMKKRRRSRYIKADSIRSPDEMEVDQALGHAELESRPRGHNIAPTTVINPTSSSNNAVKYTKTDPRKPSLACIFCKERKISCGRPPAESEDQTCNQCARRSFKCEYLTELPLNFPNAKNTGRRRRRSSVAAILPPK